MSGAAGPEMMLEAMEYADQGQPVFPCLSRDATDNRGQLRKAKAPMTAHGLNDATVEPRQIAEWWTKWPTAAIGLPTGILWDVIDVDCKPGGVNGYRAFNVLVDRGLIWDGSVKMVNTPTGGLHVYFPASGTMRNGAFAKMGVDLRGTGGYVVAPPSVLYSAEDLSVLGEYRVHASRALEDGFPMDHAAVRAILAPVAPHRTPAAGRPTDATLEALDGWLRARTEGERNACLYWAACRAAEAGLDAMGLQAAAEAIGLEPGEITRTIESAMKNARVTA